jgi:cold shock CspA family protein
MGADMRLQGRIESWNDQRGFGFVVQNATEKKAFVHISAFADRRHRPVVGALVTYELGSDERGRSKALEVRYVSSKARRDRSTSIPLGAIVAGAIVVLVIGSVAYVRVSHPNSTVEASVDKLVSNREALRANPEFRCDPQKSSCSKMTSCAEAYFHKERCGVDNMDGDADGIPCEQQWCNRGGGRSQ